MSAHRYSATDPQRAGSDLQRALIRRCLLWPTMRVFRLHLTDVTPSPDLPWARPTFPVFAFLVEHPDGPVLIDTGVGLEHDVIDELYSPVHHDLDEALAEHGVEVSDVTTVITSHLHFDHCGQNNRFAHARVSADGRGDEVVGLIGRFATARRIAGW